MPGWLPSHTGSFPHASLSAAGYSEDSDYTSELNYPVGQHPNSSASQFRGMASQMRTPGSSRENSWDDGGRYQTGYQQGYQDGYQVRLDEQGKRGAERSVKEAGWIDGGSHLAPNWQEEKLGPRWSMETKAGRCGAPRGRWAQLGRARLGSAWPLPAALPVGTPYKLPASLFALSLPI